jgi:hypothetical protein
MLYSYKKPDLILLAAAVQIAVSRRIAAGKSEQKEANCSRGTVAGKLQERQKDERQKRKES